MTKCSQDFIQKCKCCCGLQLPILITETWTTTCLAIFKNILLKGNIKVLLRPFGHLPTCAIKPDAEKQEDLFLKVNALSFIFRNSTKLLGGVSPSSTSVISCQEWEGWFLCCCWKCPVPAYCWIILLMRTYFQGLCLLCRGVLCFLGRLTYTTWRVFTNGGKVTLSFHSGSYKVHFCSFACALHQEHKSVPYLFLWYFSTEVYPSQNFSGTRELRTLLYRNLEQNLITYLKYFPLAHHF